VALVYVLGVIAAMLMGRLFSATLFRHERAAFVMELPPYRWPTARGLLTHMWERARHYLKRMGGVILLASMLLWVLTHWPAAPRVSGHEASAAAVVEHSALGRLGRVIAPVVAPLGFPWPMGVTLVSGFAAKEVMISSLSVLYQPGGEVDAGTRLSAALRAPQHGLSPLVAFAFMIFVLLYTPCVAAVLAIRREFGSVWMVVDVAYQLALAWLAAFAVFQGGRLLGLG